MKRKRRSKTKVPNLSIRERAPNIRNMRQLAMPDAAARIATKSLIGIPRQGLVILARSILTLVFGGISGTAIFILFFDQTHFVSEPTTIMLLLLLALVGLGGANFAVRYRAKLAPPRAFVTPSSVYVEDCALSENRELIKWSNVIPNERALYDVSLEFSRSYKSGIMEWQFYQHDGTQIIERRVKKRIYMDEVRCLGFKNSWELNRAILANLIVHAPTPLSLDPMVFVHLQINPRNWERMRLPKYIYFISILTLFIPTGLWYSIMGLNHTSVALIILEIILVILLIALPWAVLLQWVWTKIYPQFSGDGIAFHREDKSASEENSVAPI